MSLFLRGRHFWHQWVEKVIFHSPQTENILKFEPIKKKELKDFSNTKVKEKQIIQLVSKLNFWEEAF